MNIQLVSCKRDGNSSKLFNQPTNQRIFQIISPVNLVTEKDPPARRRLKGLSQHRQPDCNCETGPKKKFIGAKKTAALTSYVRPDANHVSMNANRT
jgi:hypothetical protein